MWDRSKRLPVKDYLRCSVTGCPKLRSKGAASYYCNEHRERFKRWGHPQQRPLLPRRVKRAEIEVRAFLRRYYHEDRRLKLRAHITDAHRGWQATLSDVVNGHREESRNRFVVEGSRRLLRVLVDTEPEVLWTRLTALWLIQQQEPSLFKDDAAFRTIMQYEVRKLVGIQDGLRINRKTHKPERFKTRIPMKVLSAMGRALEEYGSGLCTIVRTMREQSAVNLLRAQFMSDMNAEARKKMGVEAATLTRLLKQARKASEKAET